MYGGDRDKSPQPLRAPPSPPLFPPAFVAMAGNDGLPYIGSIMSLVSAGEIRYEGVLYNIDMPNSTIALSNGGWGWREARRGERGPGSDMERDAWPGTVPSLLAGLVILHIWDLGRTAGGWGPWPMPLRSHCLPSCLTASLVSVCSAVLWK